MPLPTLVVSPPPIERDDPVFEIIDACVGYTRIEFQEKWT